MFSFREKIYWVIIILIIICFWLVPRNKFKKVKCDHLKKKFNSLKTNFWNFLKINKNNKFIVYK